MVCVQYPCTRTGYLHAIILSKSEQMQAENPRVVGEDSGELETEQTEATRQKLEDVMREIIAVLRTENKELKQRVEWLEYSPRELNHLLAEVNDTGLTEVCKCAACFLSHRLAEIEPEEGTGRFSSSEDEDVPCILRDCLLWHCRELGLTHEVYDPCDDDEDDEDKKIRNCHIVIADKGGMMWEVEYGALLQQHGEECKLVQGGDLAKLKKLFDLVSDGQVFFKVDGKDYFALADANA